MLLSISETGWVLIAVVATAFFMLIMRDLLRDVKTARRSRPAPYVVPAVLGGLVIVAIQSAPQPASVLLFLYSVAFFSVPVALLPIRKRLTEATNAGAARPDGLVTAWLVGFLSVVCVASTIVLMTQEVTTP
ncbi:hypothetical protein [Streptomyces mayteni]